MRRFWMTIPLASLALVAACEEGADDTALLEQAQAQVVAEAPTADVAAVTLEAPGVETDLAIVEDVALSASPTIEAPRLVDVARLPVAETIGAVGLRVQETEGRFTIAEAIDGMPGADAGLSAGDEVVAVDGMSTDEMTLGQFIDLVRGEPGAAVTLTVVDGDATRDIELVRDELVVERDRCERIADLRTQTEFGGIGVRLGMTDGCGGEVFVRSIVDGMPAQAAGLREGDRIVSVDGLDATGAHVWDVVDVMRGAPGSTVLVGVEDAQGVARTVEIERVTIAIPANDNCR